MERIPCPKCSKKFRKRTGLEWHLKQAHLEPEEEEVTLAPMAQEVFEGVEYELTSTPATGPEVCPSGEAKKEVYISYVKAGS